MTIEKKRCGWCLKDELYIRYHDEEWGVPVHDDRKMFEFLILETFQAGLSWYTILKKRENFRKVFFDFDPVSMAGIDEKYFNKLMSDEGIIRNRAKISGAIENARMYLKLAEKGIGFSDYMWQFTEGKTIVSHARSLSELRATSAESDRMSKVMKKDGFKFTGSTVCYAHMQATGMINDHLQDCYRYSELNIL